MSACAASAPALSRRTNASRHNTVSSTGTADNSVYFNTARCAKKTLAFASDEAKAISWDRATHYSAEDGFTPWVETLLDNHYHRLGYLRIGENLGPMMQRIHGSVAKLVNDTLETRLVPFWYDHGQQSYFDGCIRDVLQAVRAFDYTLRQAERAGIVRDWREYPHTRVMVELGRAVRRAVELNAFLEGVPYARYEKHRPKASARRPRPNR